MKVAIVGYGVEGESAYKYWDAKGADITIFDESDNPKLSVPDGVTLIAGKGALSQLHGYDIIMRVPALRPSKIKTDGQITSATREFFKVCPAPIIGVTGTKGKGTTSTLIYDLLQKAGIKTHLAGNIGMPMLDLLPDIKSDHVVVLELSSFQLWDLNISPHIAVVLMIEPEHLDVHKDFEEYMTAKANIAKWQKPDDVVIYNPKNDVSERIANMSAGKKIAYGSMQAAHVKGDDIFVGQTFICKLGDVKVPGKHNIENICAALTASWQIVQNATALKQAIQDFTGLPHRIELVREVGGVKYYDDSFSSAPGAAVVAAQAFSEPKVMVLGGFDRNLSLDGMAQRVLKSGLKKALLIGHTSAKLQKIFADQGATNKIEVLGDKVTMAQIVKKCSESAQPGDVVILSPGAPSFDMFKDFTDRGEQFKREVELL
ncbi:MAG TPA: UDP-N-acetylmuramoyl-L-alanine--D-glutamate ligase [Candidatus Saccharimonadales bacterium]|nr:UDP-N-acetylmuramoyl-L-alanine--D-glutamate ligase [Candidatus Saccharimonadales bacterium]